MYVCVCARVMLFPSWNEQKGYEIFHERCISTTENKMEINIFSSLRWELLQPWAVFCFLFFFFFKLTMVDHSHCFLHMAQFKLPFSCPHDSPHLQDLSTSSPTLSVSLQHFEKYTVTLWLLNIWYSFRFTFSWVKQKIYIYTILTVSPLWNPFDFHL